MKSVSGLSAAFSFLTLIAPFAAPLAAQTGAIVQQTPSSSAVERLNQNLNRLSRQPTDMEALIGAGTASYELGDAQAANGFFTRANMVNGRDGRAKLGLALVSVALKQPIEAATYFDEADALGTRADAYLPERALAYDLTGQQDKAQRDYALALQRDPGNAELTRAYAVSLGISGKVDLAEAQMRPLLFKSDRAAWRDRTMILAMNGRTAEARRVAQTIMPRNLSDAMDPYLIRMGSLTAAQKAAAVHYGQFPADGLRLATVTSPPAAAQAAARVENAAKRPVRGRNKEQAPSQPAQPAEDSSLLAAMPRGDAPPPMVQAIPQPAQKPASPLPAMASRQASGDDDDPDGWTPAERRRAEQRALSMGSPDPVRAPEAVRPAQPVRPVEFARAPDPVRVVQPLSVAPTVQPTPVQQPRSAEAEPIRTGPVPSYATTAARAGASVQRPVQGPGLSASAASPAPAVPATPPPVATTPAAAASPVQPGFSSAPPEGAPTSAPAPRRTLAQIMAGIEVPESERVAPPQLVDLKEVAQIQAAKKKSAADKAKKEAAAKAKAEADAKAKAEAEEKARLKANPSRIWVQVATGKDPGALAFDMRRLKKTYSVLSGEDAFTAEWGATRRLLVGPFVTQAKAKALVSDLKKAGSDGFVYQSEAGEVVSSLSGK